MSSFQVIKSKVNAQKQLVPAQLKLVEEMKILTFLEQRHKAIDVKRPQGNQSQRVSWGEDTGHTRMKWISRLYLYDGSYWHRARNGSSNGSWRDPRPIHCKTRNSAPGPTRREIKMKQGRKCSRSEEEAKILSSNRSMPLCVGFFPEAIASRLLEGSGRGYKRKWNLTKSILFGYYLRAHSLNVGVYQTCRLS